MTDERKQLGRRRKFTAIASDLKITVEMLVNGREVE